jgi:MoxR-like ATPase
MAATTNARPRAASAVTVSPQDFVNVKTFLTEQVLIERTVEARMMELAAVSGTNIHLLGPPGTAKSLGLREYSKCMIGSAYFEKAMNAGMPADAIIGAYDMAKFAKSGEFTRNVDGHLPTADVGFIDEMFRANGPAQDALLPMANSEERQFEFNGGMHRSGLLLFASASNHMPDADNEQAQALVDRITLVLHVDRLKSKDSFKELIRRHHARTIANLEGTWEQDRVTITVEQVREAQRQCKYVDKTRDDFLDSLATLRDNVFREGLSVSDRRWVELVRVMQAVAWMNGRDYCTPEDCAIAEFGIATDPDHVGVAHKLVLPFLGRFETEAVEKAQEAAGPLATWAELRPLVEEAGAHLPDPVLRRALVCTRQIDDVKQRVDALIGEAENEKRDAASLRALASELLAAQKWMHDNKLPSAYTP